MKDLKHLNEIDPLNRNVTKDSGAEFSPMDPPDAYTPPSVESIDYDEMNPLLQHLIDEHAVQRPILDGFETALIDFRQNGWRLNDQINLRFKEFFTFLDQEYVKHVLKEEKLLFPHLHRRLIEAGEHGKGDYQRTAVDLMEDDHSKIMQCGSLVFNLMGLAPRLPDAASRMLVFDAAFEQATRLVESLRLHTFREEKVVFSLAQRLIPAETLDDLLRQAKNFKDY